MCWDISRGRRRICQHGAFSGVAVIVASFVPAECPKGGGYVGYIRKALEKGFSEMYGLGGGSGTIFFQKLAVTHGEAAGPGPCMRPPPPSPRVLKDSGAGSATNKCL